MLLKNPKGFSLVELLVALVIVSVLIAITAFGIGILQRNTRNTIRKNTAKDLSVIYQDISGNILGTPDSIQANGQSLNFYNGTTELGPVPLVVNNKLLPVVATDCTSVTVPETDRGRLNVCYDIPGRQVGVALEGQPTIFYFPL